MVLPFFVLNGEIFYSLEKTRIHPRRFAPPPPAGDSARNVKLLLVITDELWLLMLGFHLWRRA